MRSLCVRRNELFSYLGVEGVTQPHRLSEHRNHKKRIFLVTKITENTLHARVVKITALINKGCEDSNRISPGKGAPSLATVKTVP